MTPSIAFLIGSLWGAAFLHVCRVAYAAGRTLQHPPQPSAPPVDLADPTIPCAPPVPSDLLELEATLRDERINSDGGTA